MSIMLFRSQQALRGELTEVAERINDSREVSTDLAQNSDPSVSDQFENDANAVSDRYDSLLARLVALEQRLSEAVTQWKQFEAACADLIGWIDLQEGILENSVSEDESLPVQLEQLDICKVIVITIIMLMIILLITIKIVVIIIMKNI